MTTIGLVACSRGKLGHAAPAKDLYTSPLFRAARAYCEATYDHWFILSALHGLVAPGTVIEPYDVTLADMDPRQRREWGAKVRHAWQDLGLSDVAIGLGWPKRKGDDLHFFLHAGDLYRKPLQLRKDLVSAPLEGLRIGEQLAWYAARTTVEVPS